ncbi:hypothetical protein FOTG_11532 [Fusarium oxysporum f. sp. vasinfectum 25433]|uniref:Uncharacterized protein n=1 Tax=Fusarium oxysporum f. sp. vasinfectum 25433 TaxID=1089449 RepID=X0L3Z4_FUSOX|nr:hypothetical protein FOTG_11532 [Fusarium oxysporum f. sp. vasinfectum 25433]
MDKHDDLDLQETTIRQRPVPILRQQKNFEAWSARLDDLRPESSDMGSSLYGLNGHS